MAWREQWDRVLRWHRRWHRYTEGAATDEGLDAGLLRDDMLAFFQNAHHLKDWLQNDPNSGRSKTDVEAVINGSNALKLCADLCNGTKHFKLSTHRSGKEPKMGAGKIAVNFTGDDTAGVWLTGQDIELNDGTVIDGIAVGREVIETWEKALTAWGLLP